MSDHTESLKAALSGIHDVELHCRARAWVLDKEQSCDVRSALTIIEQVVEAKKMLRRAEAMLEMQVANSNLIDLEKQLMDERARFKAAQKRLT